MRLTRSFTLLSCCQAKTTRLSVKGDNSVMACFVPSLLIFGHSFVSRLQSEGFGQDGQDLAKMAADF